MPEVQELKRELEEEAEYRRRGPYYKRIWAWLFNPKTAENQKSKPLYKRFWIWLCS